MSNDFFRALVCNLSMFFSPPSLSPSSFSLSHRAPQQDPDHIIDLGKRVPHAGPNTLLLYQFNDLSERVFAVLLHRPTPNQLATLADWRAHRHSWEATLASLGKFDIPPLASRLPSAFAAPTAATALASASPSRRAVSGTHPPPS